MRLRALTWASDKALLVQAASTLGIDLKAWSVQDLSDTSALEECKRSMQDADVILVHPMHDGRFDDLIVPGKPVISFGFDPALWSFSRGVSQKVVATVNAYVVCGGLENIKNMLLYIGREVLGLDLSYKEPVETLWQGIYHPDAERAFSSIDDYLNWRPLSMSTQWAYSFQDLLGQRRSRDSKSSYKISRARVQCDSGIWARKCRIERRRCKAYS